MDQHGEFIAPAQAKMPEPIARHGIAEMFKQIGKGTGKVLTIATEIAVVAFIGSIIGSYVGSKTIVGDCDKFGTAKVGDQYIQCTVVQPKKDPTPR